MGREISNCLLKPERQSVVVSCARASHSSMAAPSVMRAVHSIVISKQSQIPGRVVVRSSGFVVAAARAGWVYGGDDG
jgi:hypothetical protein